MVQFGRGEVHASRAGQGDPHRLRNKTEQQRGISQRKERVFATAGSLDMTPSTLYYSITIHSNVWRLLSTPSEYTIPNATDYPSSGADESTRLLHQLMRNELYRLVATARASWILNLPMSVPSFLARGPSLSFRSASWTG